MPFIRLAMGPQRQKDYSHSKSASNHKTFIRVLEGITACDVTVIDYCTCALLLYSHFYGNMGTVKEAVLKMIIKHTLIFNWTVKHVV